MKDHCYIIVGADGIHKLCKTENFKLDPDERAFSLSIEIPDEAGCQHPRALRTSSDRK